MLYQSITVINEFEVPEIAEPDFLAFFRTHIKLIDSQPGNIDSKLFKTNDKEHTLNYISMVRWENQEAFVNAKVKINATLKKAGVDIKAFQEQHHIKVINRIFLEIPI